MLSLHEKLPSARCVYLGDTEHFPYGEKSGQQVTDCASEAIQKIIDYGMHPGIAINPGTSVESVREQLRIVDRVLVMAVNPGNASQMFLPFVGEKIDALLHLRKQMGFELYWDGACGAERMKEYVPKKMDGFVLGTTLLFGKNTEYSEIIPAIRELDFSYLKEERV